MSRRVQALLEPYFSLHDKWFIRAPSAENRPARSRARADLKEVTPHVLRHIFATLALQKGIALAAIQKILGHDRLGTTAIYLNLTDTHVVEEYSQKW
jgi:integrase/recombinase XerD